MDSTFSLLNAARPEAALLVSCARTRFDAAAADRARDLLSPDIDWEFLLRLAREHGVEPLLYRNLHAVPSDRVPPQVLDALRADYRANAAHSLLLLAETAKLLTALAAAGIEAAPLRGPVLALSAYGDVALRKSADSDLLVRLADVTAAARVLAEAGYKAEGGDELTAVQRRALTGLAHHERFIGANGGVEVEVHWRPISFPLSPHPDEWRVLDDCQVLVHGGREIPVPTPEWDFLLCCAHGYKHVFCCLKWICDIAELARSRPDLDYRWVETEAARLDCLRAVSIGSLLAADLLQAPIPEWLLARAGADRPTRRFAAEVQRRLERGEDQGGGAFDRLRSLRLQWQTAGALPGRVRFLLRRVGEQSKKDIAALKLPAPLSPLYGLAKLCRLWRH
jgi:hypothetical protein